MYSVKTVTLNQSEISFRTDNLKKFPNAMAKKLIKIIPINSKILIPINDEKTLYKEALVIAKGKVYSLDTEELIFISNSGEQGSKNITGTILSNNVDYVIPNEKVNITESEIAEINPIIKSIYASNNLNEFVARKEGRLLNFGYSIEKVNPYTDFSIGDILYDFNGRFNYAKIIEKNNDALLLSIISNDKIEYVTIHTEKLNNSIILSKNPANSTFGMASIMKNT